MERVLLGFSIIASGGVAFDFGCGESDCCAIGRQGYVCRVYMCDQLLFIRGVKWVYEISTCRIFKIRVVRVLGTFIFYTYPGRKLTILYS